MIRPLHFQNQPVYELTDGTTRALVSAEHGARLLRWEIDGREIVTWPEDADWSKLLKVRGGNPVLFPFIARHFVDGKNELWKDAAGTVRSMPQHGFSRDTPFEVIEAEGSETLRLRLRDSAATQPLYPFAFQFDVFICLLPGAKLEIAFETTNTGTAPLPYYAGHHFYFELPHGERGDWVLHLPCAAWGGQSPEGAVVREPAMHDDLHLDNPAIIDRYQIAPRERLVTMSNVRSGRALSFDLEPGDSVPWYAVTTWTQAPESDFFCVEPWLGLPNAIHHGEGLRHVAPGATERASLVLDASQW
jgi:galactose mutarotase-like enzyme